MRQRRITRALTTGVGLLALLGMTAVAGCTSGPTTPDGTDEVGTYYPAKAGTDEEIDVLTWGIMGSTTSLDPTQATASPTWGVLVTMLEPLVKVNNRGELEPVLAESYEQVDSTTIDFTLREDVTFWDGSEFTSEDAVFSVQRMADPAVSRNAGTFQNLESVTATGDHSLRITLKAPEQEFLSVLARALVVEKDFAEAAGETLGTPQGGILGTGAFQLESYAPDTGTTVVRFEDYWGELPTVQQVDVKVFTDAQALKLAMQSGDLDGAGVPPLGIPLADAASWEALPGVVIGYTKSTELTFLSLDVTAPPFDDIHVRRALAALVDFEGIIQAVYAGHGSPMRTVTTPVVWANYVDVDEATAFLDGLPRVEFGAESAAAELAQSSVPDGFEITILTPHEAAPYLTASLQTLQEVGSEVGIDITIERVTVAEWAATAVPGENPPVSVVGTAPAAATPGATALYLLRPTPSRWSNYNTPEVDEAIDAYQASETPEGTVEAAERLFTHLAEELPYIPLVNPDVAFAIKDSLVFSQDVGPWMIFGGNNWASMVKVAAE